MIDEKDTSDADSLKDQDEPKSSARLLAAIKKAENHFNDWQATCDRIDDIYGLVERIDAALFGLKDTGYDLFWASTEILKPAIYARPPKPVVAPMFNDRRKLYVTTAEMLERSVTSAYERSGIDEAMICARDDLIFYNRGQLWVTYESDKGQQVCLEHLDRKDFLHPPARKWGELPWVARRAWMTRKEMTKRFTYKKSKGALLSTGLNEQDEGHEGKAGVWEIWHKADNRVYWVVPGCENILDENPPHYDLQGFFPCPRPAYGTLKPRSLMPVPDYLRYESHFRKINSLTLRIYNLLDMVRMKGLIAGGGDVGEAIEQLMKDDSDTSILIPVPGALISGGSAGNFVQWMPVAEIAAAIAGLIEARRELFADYDRLSGISDIMRGETQASETLGAQRLKSQYGSVRVKEKCDELVRVARDITIIASEMMAEYFSQKTLLDMSQMDIPTKAELEKQVKKIEADAEKEMKDLAAKAKAMMQEAQQSGQQPTPEQAQQAKAQFDHAQQAIIAHYGPMLQKAGDTIPIEDVMKLLRDNKARNFAFEIETDSTILADETEAKASATEFYTAFTGGIQGLMGAASMGEPVIRAAAEVLKYTLSPYRPPRSVIAAIDDMLDAAPELAKRAAETAADSKDQGPAAELVKAQQTLADAKMKEVEVKGMTAQAEAQAKVQDLQLKAQTAEAKAANDNQKLMLEVQKLREQSQLIEAQTLEVYARIEALGVKGQVEGAWVALEEHSQKREDVKLAHDIATQATDTALAAQNSAKQHELGERKQGFTEASADRSMSLAERQADQKGKSNV